MGIRRVFGGGFRNFWEGVGSWGKEGENVYIVELVSWFSRGAVVIE